VVACWDRGRRSVSDRAVVGRGHRTITDCTRCAVPNVVVFAWLGVEHGRCASRGEGICAGAGAQGVRCPRSAARDGTWRDAYRRNSPAALVAANCTAQPHGSRPANPRWFASMVRSTVQHYSATWALRRALGRAITTLMRAAGAKGPTRACGDSGCTRRCGSARPAAKPRARRRAGARRERRLPGPRSGPLDLCPD
jgi:hypothetical protein